MSETDPAAVARELLSALASIRSTVIGGYEETRDPVTLISAALLAAEARGLERAAAFIDEQCGPALGDQVRALIPERKEPHDAAH